MTEDWDVYFCQVENKPASIRLDLGAVEYAPLDDYPYMGYIAIDFLHPNEHGFVQQEEFDVLAEMEDAIEAACLADGKTVYVGCCTTDGSRNMIFYRSDDEDWTPKIGAIMSKYPGYVWEVGCKDDPDWEGYFEFLYPSVYDLQHICNRRMCETMQENGDDVSVPRLIDHWFIFPTHDDCQGFCTKITERGFTVRQINQLLDDVEGEDEPEGEYQLHIVRTDAPDTMDVVTSELIELAMDFEAEYEGWEVSQ